MRKPVSTLLLLGALLLTASMLMAEEHMQEGQQGMPEMGPPEEMKHLEGMIGMWDVASKMKMDPTSDEWTDFSATAEFSYILDGAALRMDYEGQMMGMPYKGLSISAYDREHEEWQDTWVDNMTGRIMMMTGWEKDGKRVMQGKDIWNGQEMLVRTTSHNMTDDSFDWKYETSTDGGKTWETMMTATYTKRQ
ncbi:DUF1579 domain-containing protein [candidate division GN15 bacterium]|nr:DUF1579 domain-containing protein [candidate division GN15 bacterium]